MKTLLPLPPAATATAADVIRAVEKKRVSRSSDISPHQLFFI
jgi:hypothetical protein